MEETLERRVQRVRLRLQNRSEIINSWLEDSYVRSNEDMIELELALQKSMHVTRLTIDTSRLTSNQARSIMDEY
jgi:hypothetical protein